MTNEDLESFFRTTGHTVETIQGADGKPYIVIRNFLIGHGRFSGKTCDVAIERTSAVPYVTPPAVHVRPVLVPMGQMNTQPSGIGADWQYWSRALRNKATPQNILAHIKTIFRDAA